MHNNFFQLNAPAAVETGESALDPSLVNVKAAFTGKIVVKVRTHSSLLLIITISLGESRVCN